MVYVIFEIFVYSFTVSPISTFNSTKYIWHLNKVIIIVIIITIIITIIIIIIIINRAVFNWVS